MEGWQAGILIKAMAIQAEIEGMKVENQIRENEGKAFAHGPEEFNAMNFQLMDLAREIQS